jgi:hypothetical protein
VETIGQLTRIGQQLRLDAISTFAASFSSLLHTIDAVHDRMQAR